MSLAQRSLTAVSWNFASNLARSVILLARSILLARLLPVDVFGVYGFAGSIIVLSAVLANFGMDGAFLYRSPETEDDDQAAALPFTLKLIFTGIWASLLILGALIFSSGEQRQAIIILTVASAGNQLMQTPQLLLIRRVVHRRLAIINL